MDESRKGFEIVARDPFTNARCGRLTTPHGIVETPSYVIVGTHAKVRCLESEDLPLTKTQLIIANTYHMWRTLGDEGLNDFDGLHAAMGWNGPIMTDSGGFQVFSLGFLREHGMRRGGSLVAQDEEIADEHKGKNLVTITESGVSFIADEEGAAEEYLDAELSIKIQEQLGADIIVAFDEATSPMADYDYTKKAMERTHAWAKRSLDAKQSDQIFYGVVQGGAYEDLRRESAQYIGSMPFDGFAIGSTYGDAYGSTRQKTIDMLSWSLPHLPAGKPRHLFGVGRIEDLFAGVEAGIDTFDCVIPTREARHGRIWTSAGAYDVKKGAAASDAGLLEEGCGCPSCAGDGITRTALHDLFKAGNPLAGRYATMHNVWFFNDLMEKIRDSIKDGSFTNFRDSYLSKLKKSG